MAVTRTGWPLPDGRPPFRGIEPLLLRIRGLRTIGTVLHVGAHPDDEDAGLIALMARKYAARVVYWSATRGEAGQNRIGPYINGALGIYRTWESLAARGIDGGESRFGPFYDFGFCTTGDQAIERWGRDELLREIVRAIRLVQPQVLVARFSGEPADGHGQHQAVGAVTIEAFDAAADPSAFSELGLPAWRTPKFYQSTGGDWQAGEGQALGQAQPALENGQYLRIDTGEHDRVAGASYQQIAWTAFNSHRTQAMGFAPSRGRFFYYYRLVTSLVATSVPEESMYDGLDTTLCGLLSYPGGAPEAARAVLERVRDHVDVALRSVRPDDALPAASPLLEGLSELRRLRSGPGLSDALATGLDSTIARFEDVILDCLGVDADCGAARAHVAPGEQVRIRARWWNPRDVAAEHLALTLVVPSGWRATAVARNDGEPLVEYEVDVARDATLSTPSWLRAPLYGGRYTVDIQTFEGHALDAPPVFLECTFLVNGRSLSLRRPALRREAFAGGYRELPLSVVPPISVRPQADHVFLPAGPDACEIDVQAGIDRHIEQSGTVHLALTVPDGWRASPAAVDLAAEECGKAALARFRIAVPGATVTGRYRLAFALGAETRNPAVTFEPVWMGAPGLPRQPDAATCTHEAFLATAAHLDVHVIDATFARGLKYGYVEGAAEGLLRALHHFGLKISAIGDDELGFLDLTQFDAVVIGPNAYLLRDELRRNAGRFIEYVAGGGTLIVQYQAYGYELHGFAPYPFEFSHPHDRVTSPDVPVTVLEQRHALMTYPNRITEADFDGWTHDRGLYFFGRFDDRYTPILECHDAGEGVKRGGLVIAAHGRGAFVYVGYSLFRQIPAGVPGAFRILANLLALPEALLLERVERLRSLSLFAFMTGEQLMAVARIVSETQKSAGTYLCRQGDLGQDLFIVVRGEVEIVVHSDDGCVSLRAREGEVVGEFAILADIPRTADLRALTNVHLLVINGVHFRGLIREYPEVAEHVIRQLVMKILGS